MIVLALQVFETSEESLLLGMFSGLGSDSVALVVVAFLCVCEKSELMCLITRRTRNPGKLQFLQSCHDVFRVPSQKNGDPLPSSK
jgi:hypothetical protein